MARLILGIDPGLRNTGVALLQDGKIIWKVTWVTPGKGKVPIGDAVKFVLNQLDAYIAVNPDVVVVEQVGYQGTFARIALPLAHVAGAIIGYWRGRKVPVYCLWAHMKKAKAPRGSSRWTEHEKDAAILATVIDRYLSGNEAYRLKHSVLSKYLINGHPAPQQQLAAEDSTSNGGT